MHSTEVAVPRFRSLGTCGIRNVFRGSGHPRCRRSHRPFERALWGDPLMEAQFVSQADDAAFIAAYGRPVLDTARRPDAGRPPLRPSTSS